MIFLKYFYLLFYKIEFAKLNQNSIAIKIINIKLFNHLQAIPDKSLNILLTGHMLDTGVTQN